MAGKEETITGASLYAGGAVQFVAVQDWLATIEEIAVDAVVFDCDGTLVHSAEAHFLAMRDAATAQGVAMAEGWYRQRTGLDRATLFAGFQDVAGPSFDVARAIHDSIAAFPHHAALITPVPETAALLACLLERGYPVAVGTNAELSIARTSLSAVGLGDGFAAIVSISDNLPPKPDPAIFQEAARRLGVSPARCLVVEDSRQGLAAARAAGMPVLLLETAETGSRSTQGHGFAAS